MTVFRLIFHIPKQVVVRALRLSGAWIAMLACDALRSSCGGASITANPAFTNIARSESEQLLASSLTPGAVIHVQALQGDWLESFGTAERETSTPVSVDAHCHVGSIAKMGTHYGHTGQIPGFSTFICHDPLTE
ncbi:hypothetical protein [Paraburkholderia sp. C35]|uniref:hypothetical protein n=1 Tax=Paraburkholderia sp. C35 TaxID=2126993 RepID=UPI0013A5914F|nr:hypothetical protein [Paraburkholderia sp. C35]